MPRDTYTRRKFMAGTATATAVVAVGPSVATAAETTDEQALFHDPTLRDWAVWTGSYIDGLQRSARTSFSEQLFGTRRVRLQDYVGDAVDEFEAHTDEWLTYVNDRNLGGLDHQSLELAFAFEGDAKDKDDDDGDDDEEIVRYVLADYDADDSEYTSVEVADEYDSDPDHAKRLTGAAVRNAADELATIHEEYIVPNEDIEESHFARLAGRYRFLSTDAHIVESIL